MTKHEADVIGGLNMTDQISNEAYKQIMIAARDEDEINAVLDKIRAEIMQLDYDTDYVDYDYNDMVQTETIHTICREEVFQIIDKYKAESEDK